MANSNGWGDGAANNSIGWGQGANNSIGWGSSHATSWASATDIVGLTTDPAASAFIAATGITNTTEQLAIDNLVKGLKTDGIWSKMKAVYPFVTDNRNLASYTDNFSNSFWGGTSTKTPNYAAAPDGTTTACRFSGGGYLNSGNCFILAGTNVFSFYAKTTSGNTSTIRVFLDGGITTTTKTITGTWTRIETTQNFASNTSTGVGFFLDSSDILIWHPQLELGSTATTYQPIATTQQAFISSQFKYNLVNPVDSDAAFRLVFNGGWTHSSNGATPNGTNGYADTKLVANTAMNFNSQSFSDYLGTNPVAPTTCQFGSFSGSPFSGVSLFIRDGYNGMNDNILSPTMTTSTATGYFILNRNNENTKKLFRNGSSIGSTSSTATNLSNGSIFIGTANVNSTPNYYSIAQHRFFSAGDGLTDTEAANLYTRVQAFQTSLSRQV